MPDKLTPVELADGLAKAQAIQTGGDWTKRLRECREWLDWVADHGETALRELAALRAQTEWRPIAEAPRDGTVIIVSGGIAHWHDGGWWSLTGVDYPGRPMAWEPTHWQSLPPPPAESRET